MYFSEIEEGERPRDQEEICERAWRGIRVHIRTRIKDRSFGAKFPAMCEENSGEKIGCDENGFWEALRSEVTSLQNTSRFDLPEEPPQTLDILDVIQFCWQCIGKPIEVDYHNFFRHHHL